VRAAAGAIPILRIGFSQGWRVPPALTLIPARVIALGHNAFPDVEINKKNKAKAIQRPHRFVPEC
jgi:hypothetical protein